jgi:hypothetical protein
VGALLGGVVIAYAAAVAMRLCAEAIAAAGFVLASL